MLGSMEKVNWIDHMKNEEELHRVKEKRSNLPTVKEG
jgi:hypothetical protein